MDWGNVFVDAGNEADKYLEQQRANQAITSIVEQLVQGSGIQDLDPNSADFGQQAVARQGGAAQAALRALGGNQDIGSIGPAQISNLTNSLSKAALSPQEFQMKQWELQKNRRELQEQRATDQQALQAQKAAERLQLEQERKTKAREIQMAVERGDLTPERGQQAMEVLFGLQPQARQPVTSIQEFERAQKDPAYAAFLDKFRKIQNQGGGEAADKASNYVIQPDDQGNLLRINKMTGAIEPLGVKGKGFGQKPANPQQVLSFNKYKNSRVKDPNSYDLTDAEYAKAISSKMIPPGAKIKQEVIDDINQNAAMVGLPPIMQEEKTYNTRYELPFEDKLTKASDYWPPAKVPLALAKGALGIFGGKESEYGGIKEVQQPQVAPQAAPQQAPPAARQQGRPPITEADIQFTAKKYGMTRAQVLKKLGLQ